jgi:voltage-gated potassium channel
MKAMRYAKKTPKEERPLSPKRARLHEIIFESDTPAGKLFDVILLVAILLSVLAAILESVAGVRNRYGTFLYGLEWFFTILFTIEYLFRLGCVLRPSRYATSFFGIVDLMAIFPTYLSFFVVGTQSLLVIRILRLLRLFRVFKLGRYLGEARQLVDALKASRAKITVFLLTVLSVVIIMGALMYLVEGPENGFTSIPRGIYWAIVTMTTVGYGDIAPQTIVGQALAAIIMVLGYGIIAVPTGIFSANMIKVSRRTGHSVTTQVCPSCLAGGHEEDAVFCKFCGTKL